MKTDLVATNKLDDDKEFILACISANYHRKKLMEGK